MSKWFSPRQPSRKSSHTWLSAPSSFSYLCPISYFTSWNNRIVGCHLLSSPRSLTSLIFGWTSLQFRVCVSTNIAFQFKIIYITFNYNASWYNIYQIKNKPKFIIMWSILAYLTSEKQLCMLLFRVHEAIPLVVKSWADKYDKNNNNEAF